MPKAQDQLSDGFLVPALVILNPLRGEGCHNLRGWEKLEENSRYYSNWDKFQACF